jgi:hypothetical protein
MTPEEFASACRDTSRQLRKLPADVRRALAARVKGEVAEPLAGAVRSAGSGTYARRVAATTKVRASADPKIVVGGQRRITSGGATGRQLVFGTEFGGGNRVGVVRSTARRRGHRRRVTRQFVAQRSPFVFRTVAREAGPAFDRWAGIVDDELGKLTYGKVADRG